MSKNNILLKVKKVFTRKRLIISSLFIVIGCSLYHNDRFYDFFKESLNRKLGSILRVDILHQSNQIAHSLDLIGGLKRIAQPLHENDYIEIEIDTTQQNLLNQYAQLKPVKKKWIKIQMKINGRFQSAKLKLHGGMPDHHMINKYSCTIKLDKDSADYINNFRRFKLIKGEQVNPTVIAINQLANSLGLISTSGAMKMVKINGINRGYYYFVEDIKKEYLERERGITNYALITNVQDWTRKDSRDLHSSENDLYFGHIEKRKNQLHPYAVNQYKILAQHVQNNSLAEVKKKFDIDYMGKYLALASIFNDIHFMAGDNLKFIYDFNSGKFYPIYRAEYGGRIVGIYGDPYPTGTAFESYNKFLFNSMAGTYLEAPTNKIFEILLSDNEIRKVRDEYLYKFTKNKNVLINHIKNVYQKNGKIMLRCESRRNYNHEKRNQLSVLNTTLNLSSQYLNYGHIYGSYDSLSQNLNLLVDAFVPINIYHKTNGLIKANVRGIEINSDLKNLYNYQSIIIKSNDFKLKKLIFVNSLTKDTINKKHVHINFISTSDRYRNDSTLLMLKENNIRYTLDQNNLTIKTGIYTVKKDVVIAPRFNTIIEKGVTFKLNKEINFCIKGDVNINGTKNANINILNSNKNENFGTFSILGDEKFSTVNINYLHVSGGSSSLFMGYQFTSQFAIYYANINLTNSSFANSLGDDGINVKHSKLYLGNCKFYDNLADQVDLDYCYTVVSNCTFSPSLIDENGDGLDLSGSYALIDNCEFSNFLDKGLSLGENSKTIVKSCSFINNNTAIAIKDQTKVYSWDNKFQSNQLDYYSFVKKKIFNPPVLFLKEKLNSIKMKSKSGEQQIYDDEQMNLEQNSFEKNYIKYKANNQLSNSKILARLINHTTPKPH